MAFRYINPGYGALTGDSSVETFENFTYNPINGVSFQKIDNTHEIIISTPKAFTTDIYGKFNLYFDDSTNTFWGFSIGGYSAISKILDRYSSYGIGIHSNSNCFYFWDSGYNRGTGIQIKKKALNSIWFHLHKDDEQEITSGEMIVNDTKTTFVSDLNYKQFSPEPFFYVYFSAFPESIYLSELIISDEYISPKEKIIVLPTISLETNMTAGASGIYIANADNQTLFQSVDASSLIGNSENLAVTGISIYGNPAYKIGAGVANLTALSKSGTSINEHNTIALLGDSTATIFDGWGLSSISIDELQDMQFGWKAGT